jgi:hypothetical protein
LASGVLSLGLYGGGVHSDHLSMAWSLRQNLLVSAAKAQDFGGSDDETDLMFAVRHARAL